MRRVALCLFELRVPLDKLFRAASGKAYGDTAVLVVALNTDDGSDAETRVTYFASQHGIGVAAALGRRATEGTLSGRRAARSGCGLLGSAAHAAEKFFWRIRIFRVGLIAARFANFGHRTTDRFHQLTGNLRQKARRQGCAQLLFISEDAPVDGACERERLPCTGHPDVDEATLFLDSFFFGNGAAVRTNAFFHSGEEYVIEFQAFGAVQGDEGHAWLAFKLIGVTHQCCSVKKIAEALSRFHAFGQSASKFFEVFQPSHVFGSVAVLEHGHVAGFLENGMQETWGFLGGKRILQLANELLECAQGSDGAARGGPGDEFFNGSPKRRAIDTGGLPERVHRGLANAARRNIQYTKERNIILRVHRQAHVGKRVLYFGAIVETKAAHKFVTEAAAAENFFERPRLEIGTVFHRTDLVGIIAKDSLDFAGDTLSFGLRIPPFE